MDWTVGGLLAAGLLFLAGFAFFGLTSWREGEPRAARLALILAVVSSLPFLLAVLLPLPGRLALLAAVVLAALVGLILFLLPIGRVERGNDVPQARVDERDIMFARARLEPGTPNYEDYYARHPEKRAGDDKTRSLPGLLSLDSREAHPLVFPSADALFALIDELQPAVEGEPAGERFESEPEEMTVYLKGLARHLGAHSVGVTELQPYHLYSHIGRGSGVYGAPVNLDHRYALAFSVEMARELTVTAPTAPTTLESAHQYARAANIAVALALLIRRLGYPARAHIDGNYRLIAPLVARDAGLGELGRMGLLMTPTLGPRVRLGVVTTNLPLVPDGRSDDTSVLDFCRVCKKCAETCPSRAIPFGDRQEIQGALRWRINDELCFRYWNVAGTDCARCMAVCPYSYPDSAPHNLVRWAARRSGFARRAVIALDRVFYGAAPEPRPAPDWVPPRPEHTHTAYS